MSKFRMRAKVQNYTGLQKCGFVGRASPLFRRVDDATSTETMSFDRSPVRKRSPEVRNCPANVSQPSRRRQLASLPALSAKPGTTPASPTLSKLPETRPACICHTPLIPHLSSLIPRTRPHPARQLPSRQAATACHPCHPPRPPTTKPPGDGRVRAPRSL